MIVPGGPLDPELAAALEGVAPFDFDSVDGLRAARAFRAATPRPPTPDGVTCTRHTAPTGDGSVELLVYRPNDDADRPGRPCVYWVHGGGYVMGFAEPDPRHLVDWVLGLDCVLVSVDYRLAPEHPYPAGLDDTVAGLRWTVAHAQELGIDPSALALAGVSAGGGLAAAAALVVRDAPSVPLVLQLLFYPMLDDRCTTPSSSWDVPMWGAKANVWSWRVYLGPDHHEAPPLVAAPGRATADDLVGLAPAFVSVGTADRFLDEDVEYARTLLAAGVPTELHVYPGAPHGFALTFPGSQLGRQATRDARDALARVFARVRTTSDSEG